MGDKNINFNSIGTYVYAQETPSFLLLCKRIRVLSFLRFTIKFINTIVVNSLGVVVFINLEGGER